MSRLPLIKISVICYFIHTAGTKWINLIITIMIISGLFSPSLVAAASHLSEPKFQLERTCFEDICLSYDRNQLGDLVGGWVGESEIAGMPVPEHIRFWFPNYPLSAAGEWFAAIDFYSTQTVNYSSIESVLLNQPNISPAVFEEIVDINREPFPVGNAMLGLVANFRFLDFQSGTGYRYIGEYFQAIVPVNPDQLLYVYQGLSSDGRYAVSALLMTALQIAPEQEAPQSNQQFAEFIDQSTADRFIPSLNALDDVIQSITIGSVPSPTEEIPAPLLPNSSVDPDEAHQWLGEKHQLTIDLENANIPTRIFTVPAFRAYDESGARQLLSEFAYALDQGNLSPDQLELVKRLTIQERMMQQMLSPYIVSSSTVSKASVDSLKTYFTFQSRLREVWKRCGGFACAKLQEAANKLAWKSISNMGKQFIKAGGTTLGSNEQFGQMWEAALLGVQQLVEKNVSPMDILYDTGVEYLMTNLLIQPYLIRTQALIDKGVATSRDPSQGNVYPITGDAGRASSLMDNLVQKAKWESDLSFDRYQVFQNAADLAHTFQDITDIVSVVNPLFVSVTVGARVERILLNGVLINMNLDNMGCIEYLARRGAEIAFHSDQPAEDCRYWRESWKPSQVASLETAHLKSTRESPIRNKIMEESQEYQQALIELVSTIPTSDQTVIEPALLEFIDVQGRLSTSLKSGQTILDSHEKYLGSDLEAVSQFVAFDVSNIIVYLAIAENLTAKQAGRSPETDVGQVAQQALSRLNMVEQAVQKADLTMPVGKPIVFIRDVAFGEIKNGKLPIQVTIQNLGDVQASDLAVVLEGGLTPETKQSNVPAYEEETILFQSSPADQAAFTVKVYSTSELVDIFIIEAPDLDLDNKGAPLTRITTDKNDVFSLGKLLLLFWCLFAVVLVLGLAGIILGLNKSRSVKRRKG